MCVGGLGYCLKKVRYLYSIHNIKEFPNVETHVPFISLTQAKYWSYVHFLGVNEKGSCTFMPENACPYIGLPYCMCVYSAHDFDMLSW